MTTEQSVNGLVDQWEQLRHEGAPVSAEELCGDCPELLAEVQRRIQALQAMRQFLDVQATTADKSLRPPTVARAVGDPAATPETAPPAHSNGRSGEIDSALTIPAIPGYELLGELGKGGMGVVYKARHLGLKRLVALKMVLPGRTVARQRARFLMEAEAVARMQHPNIVQIYEIGAYLDEPYFSLEFVDGESLDSAIRMTPQSGRDSAVLVRTLASAIQAAHDKQIIHRDLKPANVLLAGACALPLSQRIPKIGDFGLAKQLDAHSGQTNDGTVVGTPSYMAPEQAEGANAKVGAPADIYALGAILYELLTGRPPFKGESIWQTLMQVTNVEPVLPSQLNPSCPRDLETICLKCLQKKREARYPSAQALADDLGRYLEGKPILARPANVWERLGKWVRRAPFQAASLVAGCAFVLTLIAALYGRMESLRQEAQEDRRQDELRTRIADHFGRAEATAATASENDTGAWRTVERESRSALDLIAGEPGFAEFSLREPALRLLRRAEGKLANVRERDEYRALLKQFEEIHSAVVVFGTLSLGLEQQENATQTREAAQRGLALFQVTPENDSPPSLDARFADANDTSLVTTGCYEILLIYAGVLGQPRLGEKAGEWHGRLRQALLLLDRADRLLPGRRVRSGLTMRADFLAKLGEADRARQMEQAAQACAPELATDYFLLGLEQHSRGDYANAIAPLGNAIRLQPGHFGANYLLAVCHSQEEHWQDAKVSLSACVRQQPNLPWPRLLRAATEIELGEFEQALADLNGVLEQPPDATALYIALVNRGVLRMRQSRWDDAATDFKAAIAKKPDDIAAYVNLALAHRQRAEIPAWQPDGWPLNPGGVNRLLAFQTRKQAVAVLDEAVKQQPSMWRLYHERGRLLLVLNRTTEAGADFRLALALAPNRRALTVLANDLVNVGGQLHREKDFAGAIRAYDAALALNPSQTLTHRLKAEPLLALRKYREAGEALDLYLKSLPPVAYSTDVEQSRKTADAFKARGIIWVEQKDFRAAIDSFTQGLKVERDAALLTLRGGAYLMFNAPTLALFDFDEALLVRSGDVNALLGKADACVRLGRVSDALVAVEQGVQRSSATSRPFYLAARVYAQIAGKWEAERYSPAKVSETKDRAFELLRKALANVPDDDRPAFWTEYIEADAALRSLRSSPEWRTLAAEMGRPAK